MIKSKKWNFKSVTKPSWFNGKESKLEKQNSHLKTLLKEACNLITDMEPSEVTMDQHVFLRREDVMELLK